MQTQHVNPTLKTLRVVEQKLHELGAVKNINELKEALHNQVAHQAIKVCLAYLEEKHLILVSVTGGIAYVLPRHLSKVKTQGTVI